MIDSVGTGRPAGAGADGAGAQIDNEIRRLQNEIKSLQKKGGASAGEQVQKQIQALQEKIAQLQQRKSQGSKNAGGGDAASEIQQEAPRDQLLDVRV